MVMAHIHFKVQFVQQLDVRLSTCQGQTFRFMCSGSGTSDCTLVFRLFLHRLHCTCSQMQTIRYNHYLKTAGCPDACMHDALQKVRPVVSRTFGADEDLVLMGGGEKEGGGVWALGHDVIVRPCNPLALKPNQQRLEIV